MFIINLIITTKYRKRESFISTVLSLFAVKACVEIYEYFVGAYIPFTFSYLIDRLAVEDRKHRQNGNDKQQGATRWN